MRETYDVIYIVDAMGGRSTPLYEGAGVIAAGPAPVLDALVGLLEPRLRAQGTRVEVDRAAGILAVRGEWWFSGQYVVRPHGQGALLTYAIRDVATRARLLVPLVHGLFVGFGRKQDAAFADLLADISATLGADARMVRCPSGQ
jgi:hypothetical protein